MSFGLPLGGVWAWLLLAVWLCIDWLKNLEMWKMPKLVTASVTTGLNVLGALRGQDGKESGHATDDMSGLPRLSGRETP